MSNARELAELSGSYGTGGFVGMKNRIINGDMRIDQRNAGASVTLTAANFVYPVDRWFAGRASGTSGAIAQRVSGSYVGGYALRVQRNNGDTSTSLLGTGQVIESANCIGFAGNSITRSFRARCGANFSAASSQITARIGTGTGTDQSAANFWNNAWTGQSNSDATITLTTSWQSFSVTTSAGASVNQVGLSFFWTPSGTAGANDWVEIEEVQLEKGSTATSFDFRPYGAELALCQRYLPCYSATSASVQPVCSAYSATSTIIRAVYSLKVNPRVPPAGVTVSSASHFSFAGAGANPSSITFESSSIDACVVQLATTGATATAGSFLYSVSASAQIQFTGCEL